jgi:hypothetical protein
MQLIAVSGFSYSISDMSTPGIAGVIALTGIPSLKSFVNGKGVCKHNFSLTVSAVTCNVAGATTPDPVVHTATFQATAIKCKADGSLVLRINDKTAIISASPSIPGSPPVPYPVTFKIQITNAGQIKVQSN